MQIINLPKITDRRGNLTFIESNTHIPFDINRVYYLYDVPGGQFRGSHAYKKGQEMIIALSGSFDVLLNNGHETKNFTLNRANSGLFVPNLTWRSLSNFSTNSICLVVSSTHFNNSDYINSFNEFNFILISKENTDDYPQINFDIEGIKLTESNKTTLDDCKLVELYKNEDPAGNLTAINNNLLEIPFFIKRVFYLYDIPGGMNRGAHAHKKCHQLLIAPSGSFSVSLNDGKNEKSVSLFTPNIGLHIPPGIWAAEKHFSSGAICLVLASDFFDESDYIRNYDEFLEFKNKN